MPAFDLRTHTRTARDHARTAGTALVNWWRAVSIEALCVAVLWWIGLALLGIPLAPLWALIGGLMTFVPNFGGVITVIFPVMMVLFSGRDLYRLGFVLGLYAIIVVIDQLVLQPWLLEARHAGAHLGLHLGAHPSGHHHPLLGSPPRPASARHRLRVPQA